MKQTLCFLISVADDTGDIPLFIPILALIGITVIMTFLTYRFLFKRNFTDLKINAEKVNKKKNVVISVIILLAALGIMIWASGTRKAVSFALIFIALFVIGTLLGKIYKRFNVSRSRQMFFAMPLMGLYFAAMWFLKVMKLKMCVAMAIWFTIFPVLWVIKIEKQDKLMALSRPVKILISIGIPVLFIVITVLVMSLIK